MAPGPVAADYGLGTHTAAQILLSWSHAGRIRTEAAFGRRPGPPPSGYTDPHRVNRLGDREIRRCIKRYLACHLYRTLNRD